MDCRPPSREAEGSVRPTAGGLDGPVSETVGGGVPGEYLAAGEAAPPPDGVPAQTDRFAGAAADPSSAPSVEAAVRALHRRPVGDTAAVGLVVAVELAADPLVPEAGPGALVSVALQVQRGPLAGQVPRSWQSPDPAGIVGEAGAPAGGQEISQLPH